jgi:hypothetical protein
LKLAAHRWTEITVKNIHCPATEIGGVKEHAGAGFAWWIDPGPNVRPLACGFAGRGWTAGLYSIAPHTQAMTAAIPTAPALSHAIPSHKWLVALAVMLGTTLEVLDTSIVNVALSHMQGAFSAGVDEIAWVLTSYLVANGNDGLDLIAFRPQTLFSDFGICFRGGFGFVWRRSSLSQMISGVRGSGDREFR